MSSFVLEFQSCGKCVLHSFEHKYKRDVYFKNKDAYSLNISSIAAKLLLAKDERLGVVLHV
jgi:uncharacterized cysteine cluster protein YcgN (CxxCxxCC family)